MWVDIERIGVLLTLARLLVSWSCFLGITQIVTHLKTSKQSFTAYGYLNSGALRSISLAWNQRSMLLNLPAIFHTHHYSPVFYCNHAILSFLSFRVSSNEACSFLD
jgi:hypothetical protein